MADSLAKQLRRGNSRRGYSQGSGTGLDADTLDGQDNPYFLSRANHTGTQDHNSTLSGIQGGGATERYHLTAAQQTDLTDGGISALHRHAADYGEMYADNAAHTVVISAGNTWTDVDGGLTGGTSNAFTFQNSKELKCNVAGKYLAVWSMSLETTGANDNIEGSIGIGGTRQANTTAHVSVAVPNEEFHFSGTGILTLVVNDLVRLMVNNNTDADDVVLQHANLTLWKIND